MTDLTISMIAPALPYFPVWVAQQQGMFAEHDLTVTTERTGATDKVTTSLADGASQLAMVTPEGVIVNAAAGGSLRLVAGNTNRAPLALIVPPEITLIEDLAGKTIGTSSLKEGTAILVQRILAAHGLHYPGDYAFALVGAHPQRWQHLQDGSIDAGLQLVPYDYLAEDAGYRNLGNAWDYVPHYAFTAVAVDQRWADDHPDLVTAALGALQAATEWAFAHRDDAARIAESVTGGGIELARRGLDALIDHGSIARDLGIDPRALDSVFGSVRDAALVDPGAELGWSMCVEERYLSDAS